MITGREWVNRGTGEPEKNLSCSRRFADSPFLRFMFARKAMY